MNRKTILVIEDEEDTVLFLTDRLEMAGYRVETAGDGRSGVEKARSLKPDLVLLDASLPEMDGFEACRRLKSDPATAGAPVLLVTARAQDADRARGRAAGCDDYLAKPFETDLLLEKIDGYLK